jgi:hypothetical protein
MTDEYELLVGVSIEELEALATGVLVPSAQARLDGLLAGAREHRISSEEERKLDDLLGKVDQLNLLKARALYTIDRLGAKASST